MGHNLMLAKSIHCVYNMNMAIKNIQLRLDEGLKVKAERVLEDLGLDMPTALRLFLKKIVHTKAIPFRISLDSDEDNFSASQIGEILKARDEAMVSSNLFGPFDTAEQMTASLKKKSK